MTEATPIDSIAPVIADALGISPGTVTKAAEHLARHRLIASGDIAPTFCDVANVLIGLMASHRVVGVSKAVEAYRGLPARYAHRHLVAQGGVVSSLHRIEDVPIIPGGGPAFVSLTRSLSSCIASVLAGMAAGEHAMYAAQVYLTICRNISDPAATLSFPIYEPDGSEHSGDLIYQRHDELDPFAWDRGMVGMQALRGTALEAIAQFLDPPTPPPGYAAKPALAASVPLQRAA